MHRRGNAGAAASPGADSGNAPANVLFLPVFMVLLVFFIVLVAKSVPRQEKVSAVLTSLERRFPPFLIDKRLQGGDAQLASRSGTVFAAERLDGLGKLFATMIAVAEVDKVTPGRLMEVRLPADALFISGGVLLRREQEPLLDRVAAAMRDDPPGERLELEALLSIDDNAPSQGPGPVQRAGALARALAQRGVPVRAMTVGVERGAPGAARLRFVIRDETVGRDDTVGGGRDAP